MHNLTARTVVYSLHKVGEDWVLGVARQNSRSPLGGGLNSRPVSAFDFRTGGTGPDEGAITEAIRSCLAEVDLDTVTKKQGQFFSPYIKWYSSLIAS